jgi:hypothetical protein
MKPYNFPNVPNNIQILLWGRRIRCRAIPLATGITGIRAHVRWSQFQKCHLLWRADSTPSTYGALHTVMHLEWGVPAISTLWLSIRWASMGIPTIRVSPKMWGQTWLLPCAYSPTPFPSTLKFCPLTPIFLVATNDSPNATSIL